MRRRLVRLFALAVLLLLPAWALAQSTAVPPPGHEDDPVIQGALGPELAEEFVRVKRQEWVRYHNTVSRWEIDRYLTLF